MVPSGGVGGWGGGKIAKIIFAYLYIKKNPPLQNHQAHFNQTLYKSSLGKVYFKLVK
jgi:hypothetical protein